MKHTILIIGSYNQDLIWRTQHFPEPGETVSGTFSSGAGGKGSNQAIAAARTGVPTAFIGALGRDTAGESAKTLHKKEGIQSHWAEKTDIATGNAAILIDETGQNEIIGALGANLALEEEDIPEETLLNAYIVAGQPEANPAAIRAALKKAHAQGITTVLNPAPVPETFDMSILPVVDILIPNEIEFAALVRLHPPCDAPKFTPEELLSMEPKPLHALCRKLNVPTIIITLGKKGCFVSTPQSLEFIPAHENVETVDTTGAGDCYIGTFTSGLTQYKDLHEAAHYANAAAALAVGKAGAAQGMPHQKDILAFWKQNRLLSNKQSV